MFMFLSIVLAMLNNPVELKKEDTFSINDFVKSKSFILEKKSNDVYSKIPTKLIKIN